MDSYYDEPLAPWERELLDGPYRGCTLVTDTGQRFTNVREESIILAGARKEFISFEEYGSDRIYYVPASYFWTEAQR